MKKIMFFRPLFYIGGTENAILSLIKKLKGFDIYIGYSDDTSDKKLLESFSKYGKVVDIKNGVPFELDVFIPCTDSYYLDKYVRDIKRKKTILWHHHFKNYPKSALEVEEEYKNLDYIVTVSEASKNKLAVMYPHLKEKIITIHNVLDCDDVRKKSLQPIDLNLSETLNLVTVSRICKEKGFDRMLNLAWSLNEAKVNFKWFIIGDNYYKEDSKEIISRYEKLKNNFVWFGFLDNPHNIVKKCDYSVLLSDDETWGLVLTEAMVLGVPCISSDFDSAFEQITDGENGIILSRDNTESYKLRIPDILNNKDKYKKALINFSYENDSIVTKWMEVFYGNKILNYSSEL